MQKKGSKRSTPRKTSRDKKGRPRFITVEGGEGAGKTTLLNALEEILRAHGSSVVRTREPGGTPFGDAVRSWLLRRDVGMEIGSLAELLLFLASRAQHIEEVINPALKSGKVVLCDRFNDSTIAYQGAGRGLGEQYVKSLCEQVCGKSVPDLTFYLDVDPTLGLERARHTSKAEAAAGEADKIESEKIHFHKVVRASFLAMAKREPKRFRIIDASKSKQAVLEEAKKVLLECLE